MTPKISVLTGVGRLDVYGYAIQGYFNNLITQRGWNTGVIEALICYVEWHPLFDKYSRLYPDQIICFKDTECNGVYPAWNQMIHKARGEYVTNWNIDDRRKYNALIIQQVELEAYDAALVYNLHYRSSIKNESWEHAAARDCSLDPITAHLCGKADIADACTYGNDPMWRKDLHRMVGYFDQDMKICSDWDMWCKITDYAGADAIRFVAEPLGVFYFGNTVSRLGNGSVMCTEQAVVRARHNKDSWHQLTIIQPARLGDIIIVMPIAQAYKRAGYAIHMPVAAQYYDSLVDAFHYVNWIQLDVDDATEAYLPALEALRNRNIDRRSLNLAMCLHGNEEMSAGWHQNKQTMGFDEYKYHLAKVPLATKFEPLRIRRNVERERQLAEYLVGSDDPYNTDYVVLNKHSSLGVWDIPVPGHEKVVEVGPLTHNIFDWCGLLEHASHIYTADTALANLACQIGCTNVTMHIRQYPPTMRPEWKIVNELAIPTPERVILT